MTLDLAPSIQPVGGAAPTVQPQAASPEFVPCASPVVYQLGNGNYIFSVSATDGAGNTQTSATYNTRVNVVGSPPSPPTPPGAGTADQHLAPKSNAMTVPMHTWVICVLFILHMLSC